MGEVIHNKIKWVPRYRIYATCRQSGEVSKVEVKTEADAVFVAESFRLKGDCSRISVLDRRTGELVFHPELPSSEVKEA